MSDKTQNATATPDQPVAVTGSVTNKYGVKTTTEIAVQSNQALIVAQFADMDSAKAAYHALIDAEVNRALDIDGVLVANADSKGKVHIQKMTDHKTRNGFLWGAVGGAAIGLIFPPSILAGAVAVGVAGAALGKAGNELWKGEVADDLAGVSRRARRASWPSCHQRGRCRRGDDPERQGRQVRSDQRPGCRCGQAGRQGRGRQGCRLTEPSGKPVRERASSGWRRPGDRVERPRAASNHVRLGATYRRDTLGEEITGIAEDLIFEVPAVSFRLWESPSRRDRTCDPLRAGAGNLRLHGL